MERVSSPEQLDRYIRTGSKGYIVLLTAIIVLLAGVLFWALTGKLETRREIACAVTGGQFVCCLDDITGEAVGEDLKIRIGEKDVLDLTKTGPVLAGQSNVDPILIDAAGLEKENWCYLMTGKTDIEDGTYRCILTFDSISPIALIFD